ncbi:hypothetical protein BKCO1_4000072 [Neofusicoccum parvum]|uniref:Uncharacterized protein n=1 Tax=Neofusicoccum parvum TaxID=310453 RepID=A0ACB5SK63_9PEZI|nr:hypothetical protein BKCO1_4000072 [Neofusicoccum parvum]GME45070.1 hypothetical protein BKCO1_4000072 [Neofusicoccum parvum]
MPIFHDDDEPRTPKPAPAHDNRYPPAHDAFRDRRDELWSVDYLRGAEEAGLFGWQEEQHSGDRRQSTLDRVTLIERLKRSQSPPWQQSQTLNRAC